MNKVKVLVVEDEYIVAQDISNNLAKFGYAVTAMVRTGEDAIQSVKTNEPDIVLFDVRLEGKMDGVTAAEKVRLISRIPFIYITAYSDKKTFERAKFTAPHAYILKPFNFSNLHAAIELAMHNFSNNTTSEPGDSHLLEKERPSQFIFNDSIFIRSGKGFEKVRVEDVCYIKADGSYSLICTHSREYTLSMNLNKALLRLCRPEFLRVHRTYAVNMGRVDRIEERAVIVDGKKIPVIRKMRDELMKRLRSV
jgi:DNA-binding LytR/AlgR family response regulator